MLARQSLWRGARGPGTRTPQRTREKCVLETLNEEQCTSIGECVRRKVGREEVEVVDRVAKRAGFAPI